MSEDINGSTLGKTDFSVDGINPDKVDEVEDGVVELTFATPFIDNPVSVLVYGDGTSDVLPNGVKSLSDVWTIEHTIEIGVGTTTSFSEEPKTSSSTIVDYAMETDEVWDISGSPYIVSGFVIPEGLTLTVEAGVVVMIEDDNPIVVKGELIAEGEPMNKISLTSVHDLTNETQQSLRGIWRGIIFEESSFGRFLYTDVKYGTGIENNGGEIFIDQSSIINHQDHSIYQKMGTIDIQNSEIGESSFYGIQIEAGNIFLLDSKIYKNINGLIIRGPGEAIVRNINFEENSETAIDIELRQDRPFDHINNRVTGGNHRGILISSSSENLSELTTISEDLPYFVRNLIVDGGKTLTIKPGVTIKFLDEGVLKVGGTLNILGTNEEKVHLTSIHNDLLEGDSNGDGSETQPSSGDWFGIEFDAGSVGNISNTDISYAGKQISYTGSGANIFNNGGDIFLDRSTLSNSWFSNIRQDAGTFEIRNSILKESKENIIFYGGDLFIEQSIIFPGEFTTINNQSDGISVNAVNNYWNESTGPFHENLNSAGLGSEVGEGVSFIPWLESEPIFTESTSQEEDPVDTGSSIGTTTNSCGESCYSNILFLPGIMGSRLYDVNGKLWEPFGSADVEALMMGEGGVSIRNDIYAKDVIDEIYGLLGNVYKSFLEDLELWKTEENLIEDYGAIPYDWRVSLDELVSQGFGTSGRVYYSGLSAATSTPYILQELRRLISSSRTGKVTIIAHSNGGLLAKKLMKELKQTGDSLLDKIDKIVLVGVPQLGTPQAIGALLHGYDMGLPNDLFSFILSPEIARNLALTMPSLYHLLPVEDYFDNTGVNIYQSLITFEEGVLTDNFVEKYGYGISNSIELHNFMIGQEGRLNLEEDDVTTPAKVDSDLLSYGESARAVFGEGEMFETIKFYQIAGWGAATLAGIKYSTGSECVFTTFCLTTKPKLSYAPHIIFDGDGTVIVPSGLAMSDSATNISRWWLNLEELSNWDKKWSHKDIFEIDELRKFIKENILIGNSGSVITGIYSSEPETQFDRRLNFILHSPLSLSVTNGNGGVVSSTDQSIDGGYYRRYGEVQFISVPTESNPTVSLNGEEDGSFTLEVSEEVSGIVIDKVSFISIPNKKETFATMSFEDGSLESASALYLDEDGDGKNDFFLEPNSEGNTIDYQDAKTVTAENTGADLGFSFDTDSGNRSELLSKEDEDRLLKQIQKIAETVEKLIAEKESKQKVAGAYVDNIVLKKSAHTDSKRIDDQKEERLSGIEKIRRTVRSSVLDTLQASWNFLGAFKGY